MDQSPNTSPQKTSPFIIKLCCASTSKEPDESSSEPIKDPLTSPEKKPTAIKIKPLAVTLCRLSKDGILTKSPEPLKISPALSLKLGAALRERIPFTCLPSQKVTVNTKLDKSNEAGIQRQSLTSHSSKLSDNRLDFVQGGDTSQVLQLSQPPLTMQPSNLHTDDLLDAKYGGGGLETTIVQRPSTSTLSPIASSCVASTKCAKKQLAEKETEMEPAKKKIKLCDTPQVVSETEMEPAKKKIKLCDTPQVVSESQSLSPIGVTIANISTKKPKIIEFRSPPGKKISVEPSVCMLEKGKGAFVIAQPRNICPFSSSVEKTKDESVKLEQTKIILDKKPADVTTQQPHFVIACSSENSNFDSKIDTGENLNTSSLFKSKDSSVNQQLIKADPEVVKISESDVKEKIKKPDSVFDVTQGNTVDILESSVNIKSTKCSSPINAALNSETITKKRAEEIKVNDSIISQMETCEIDQNLKSNHENTCTFDQPSGKSLNFSLENTKAISFYSNQDDGMDIVKSNPSKIRDGKNLTIDTKDEDNNSRSSCKQNVKVCPFKLNFKGNFNAEKYKPKKVKFKSDVLKKDVSLHITKDDVNSNISNDTDLNSNKSLKDYNDVSNSNNSHEKDSQSKELLEKSSKSNSQSELVVNNNNEIEGNELHSKETKLEAQDEDYSGDEGNELLGISSDESNQMDSQNGYKEPEMEFDILDEFESNDNDPDQDARSSDSESEISANEIDAMLEAGLGDYGKQSPENQHEVKEKLILKVRGKDHFEVLPEGWIEVTHNSGIPIYLHKQTRVCCVSKPYFLGPGSTRKHEIPISAIPCLQYQKELEKEKLEAESKLNGTEEDFENKNSSTNNTECKNSSEVNGNVIDTSDKAENHVTQNGCEDTKVIDVSEIKSGVKEKNVSNVAKGSNLIFPSAKLESVKEVKVTGSLDYLAVREYCQKRFEFQTITVKRFKTWFGRRKHQKQIKRKQRPFLPDNTQLITCPLPANTDKSTTTGSTSKREFIMNPTGKSPVCILHEYVQHTLRVQPKYIFKELESASTPYGAVVIINEMEYGTGYGSSKKVAKSEAARSALEVLIPKIKKFDPEKRSGDEDEFQDVEFFDQVRVEDPRISDLSVKAGQPFPYQILLECLKRNYGMGDTEINIKMKNLKHQKNEFIMKVGKHKATVVCKNKRDGKHRASQAILQQLHPHIISWGSLLRMYGKGSCKTLKEKKEEEQRITELQSKACVNKPNVSILNKLKEEMMKYREKMKSKKPIGKLIPERMQLFSISDSNLKSIEL